MRYSDVKKLVEKYELDLLSELSINTSDNEQIAKEIAINALGLSSDFIKKHYGYLTDAEVNQITEYTLSKCKQKELRVSLTIRRDFRNINIIEVTAEVFSYPDCW